MSSCGESSPTTAASATALSTPKRRHSDAHPKPYRRLVQSDAGRIECGSYNRSDPTRQTTRQCIRYAYVGVCRLTRDNNVAKCRLCRLQKNSVSLSRMARENWHRQASVMARMQHGCECCASPIRRCRSAAIWMLHPPFPVDIVVKFPSMRCRPTSPPASAALPQVAGGMAPCPTWGGFCWSPRCIAAQKKTKPLVASGSAVTALLLRLLQRTVLLYCAVTVNEVRRWLN